MNHNELVSRLRPHIDCFSVSIPGEGEVTMGGCIVSTRPPIRMMDSDGGSEIHEGFYVAHLDDGLGTFYVDLDAEEAYPYFKDIFVEGRIIIVSGILQLIRNEIRIKAYNIKELSDEEPALV